MLYRVYDGTPSVFAVEPPIDTTNRHHRPGDEKTAAIKVATA